MADHAAASDAHTKKRFGLEQLLVMEDPEKYDPKRRQTREAAPGPYTRRQGT